MIIINHRINTISKLKKTPINFGVEIDLRSKAENDGRNDLPGVDSRVFSNCENEAITKYDDARHKGVLDAAKYLEPIKENITNLNQVSQKLLVKGIFDGEHYFILSQEDGNKTKFIHGEKFSGILVYLVGKTLDKTKGGFELMNESLRVECEKDYKN